MAASLQERRHGAKETLLVLTLLLLTMKEVQYAPVGGSFELIGGCAASTRTHFVAAGNLAVPRGNYCLSKGFHFELMRIHSAKTSDRPPGFHPVSSGRLPVPMEDYSSVMILHSALVWIHCALVWVHSVLTKM